MGGMERGWGDDAGALRERGRERMGGGQIVGLAERECVGQRGKMGWDAFGGKKSLISAIDERRKPISIIQKMSPSHLC